MGGGPASFGYRDQAAPVLGAASNLEVTLTLPDNIKVSVVWLDILHSQMCVQVEDLKWISVWCRRYSVDFGHLIISDSDSSPDNSNNGENGSTNQDQGRYYYSQLCSICYM